MEYSPCPQIKKGNDFTIFFFIKKNVSYFYFFYFFLIFEFLNKHTHIFIFCFYFRVYWTLWGMEGYVASCPGKIILFGEHAVVHGRLAVAAALGNRRTYVRVAEESKEELFVVELADFRCALAWPAAELAAELADAAASEILGPWAGSAGAAGAGAPPAEAILRELERRATIFVARGRRSSYSFSGSNARIPSEDTRAQSSDAHAEIRPCPKERPPCSDDGGAPGSGKAFGLVAFLLLAVGLAAAPARRARPGMVLTVWSDLPVGAGLGSSASYSVAVAAALLRAFMGTGSGGCPASPRPWAPEAPEDERRAWRARVNEWAFEAERLIHGTPSGIDNSVATYGGALTFQRNAAPPHRIEPLAHMPPVRALVCNTRVPRSTKDLVAGVAQRLREDPPRMGRVLDDVHTVAERCVALFARSARGEVNDADAVAELEDLAERNQALLNEMGVGHEALDWVCAESRSLGRVSKLTGAGGGGCAFTLLHPDDSPELVAALIAALDARFGEGSAFEAIFGGSGVNFDK